jgi:hypothetical protein
MAPRAEAGMALLSTVMVMMLVSALLAGFVALVVADQQAGGLNRDQTQAYAAAHAGLEKLTADLGDVFLGGNYSPNQAVLDGLEAQPPTVQGFAFDAPGGVADDGYRIVADPVETKQVPSGPFQGLVGLITPYTITVTARSQSGGEVRMRRTMQTVGVPVFQFGIFSENDLSFHANEFAFGGRVHSNANIFIASVANTTLTLSDRVSAVGEIIRTHFANGQSAAAYTGTIRAATTSGCKPPPATAAGCRNLAANEGSLVGNVGSAANPNWTNISTNLYKSYLRTSLTGARSLELPLVSDGAEPVDIIRRPNPASPDPLTLRPQRFYNLASLRILLSDTVAELTSLPDVVGTPVSLGVATLPVAAGGRNLARSTGNANDGYRSPAGTPLINGFILINRQDTNGNWHDVTNEILSLGITGRNLSNSGCTNRDPNAIIRLQHVKDAPAFSGGTCGATGTPGSDGRDLWSNALYDPREGLRRDNESTSQNLLYLGGIVHYVELDVNNYKRWVEGTIGTSGSDSQNETGYVVYFSDRRNNRNAAGFETGEYGWEDFINSDSVSTPNGTLQVGEDMNASGTLETYGNTPVLGYTPVAPSGSGTWGSGSPLNATANVWSTTVNRGVARANRPVFFRRALKLANGGLGQLPSNGLQGLTVASENPVYVQGNYNACGLPTAACASNGFDGVGMQHRSAAIIADAVTLLSRAWNDINSFTSPHNPAGRAAATTWYRMGVIAGKGVNFPYPNNNAGDPANFGSDGGAHNFLRFVEDWGASTIFNYRGSMVSLFTSRQAVGTWKCCQNVYNPPGRTVVFEEEFLDPMLLPPRTPMFRDVNTLTFRQLLRPTQ